MLDYSLKTDWNAEPASPPSEGEKSWPKSFLFSGRYSSYSACLPLIRSNESCKCPAKTTPCHSAAATQHNTSFFRAASLQAWACKLTQTPTMPSLLEGLAGEGSGLPLTLLVPLVLLASLLLFLRPRKAGRKDAPPLITSSPVSSVPLLGPAIEFGKSPVKMVRRCYDDYGPVFTVPVSLLMCGGCGCGCGCGCARCGALLLAELVCCVVTSCRVPCVLFAGEQLHWPSEPQYRTARPVCRQGIRSRVETHAYICRYSYITHTYIIPVPSLMLVCARRCFDE